MRHPSIRKSWHQLRQQAAVAIARSRTKATELFLLLQHYYNLYNLKHVQVPALINKRITVTAIQALQSQNYLYNKILKYMCNIHSYSVTVFHILPSLI
jgi:hypothetical protein